MFYSEGKGDNIKREFTIKDYLEGGLRMIDINTFIKLPVLRSTLIRKIMGNGFFFMRV